MNETMYSLVQAGTRLTGLFILLAAIAAAATEDEPGEDRARWYHGRRMYDRRIDLRPDAPPAPEIPDVERREPMRRSERLDIAPVNSTLLRSPAPPPAPPRRPPPANEDDMDPADWLLEAVHNEDVIPAPSFSGWGWLAEQVIADRQRKEEEDGAEDEENPADMEEWGGMVFGADASVPFPLGRGLLQADRRPVFDTEDGFSGLYRDGRDPDAQESPEIIGFSETRSDPGGEPPGNDVDPEESLAAIQARDRDAREIASPEPPWPGEAPRDEAYADWRQWVPDPGQQLAKPLDPAVRPWTPHPDAGVERRRRRTDRERMPGPGEPAFPGETPATSYERAPSDATSSREWDPFERGQIFSSRFESTPSASTLGARDEAPATEPRPSTDDRFREANDDIRLRSDGAFREEPVFHW